MSADKKRESPLAGSALFQPQPMPPIPQLPSQAHQTQGSPVVPVRTPQAEETPLLYKSKLSDDYIGRSFDHKYDKQAINAHPYLIGAVEALGKILHKNKTEMYEEMMRDFVKKYGDLLDEHPDLVRDKEQKYREKHHL